MLNRIIQFPFSPVFLSRFSPLCVSCNDPIVPDAGSEETIRVVALEKNFHLKCYRCEVRRFLLVIFTYLHALEVKKLLNKYVFKYKTFSLQDCTRPLSIEADENGCYPLDGRILCMKCHTLRARQAKQWFGGHTNQNQIQTHSLLRCDYVFATWLCECFYTPHFPINNFHTFFTVCLSIINLTLLLFAEWPLFQIKNGSASYWLFSIQNNLTHLHVVLICKVKILGWI